LLECAYILNTGKRFKITVRKMEWNAYITEVNLLGKISQRPVAN